ncbi:hypothetical protein AGMMS49959_00110 [Planctomycetales bacterium]|nr:hypothetical protein AGMMS49959_00110 [Planctomycetales bacterium]
MPAQKTNAAPRPKKTTGKAGKMAPKSKNSPDKNAPELSCSECAVRNCYRRDKKFPAFCLTTANPDAVRATRELYRGDHLDARLARVAATIEGEYYGRLTRVEETIIFAQKLGVKKLGIASCIGLLDEATQFAAIVRAAGIAPRTVICKIGGIDKTEIGLAEELKVCPQCHESCCNPVLQARELSRWGAELNVLIGLCVGHDALFYRHTTAPTTTLIVKDRVLAHNPAAALYTAKFYYKRLQDPKNFPAPRGGKNRV